MQKSVASLATITLGAMLAIGPAHAAVAPGMPQPPTYTPPAPPAPTRPLYNLPTPNDYRVPFLRASPRMSRSAPRR
jgi:hypothetical protein